MKKINVLIWVMFIISLILNYINYKNNGLGGFYNVEKPSDEITDSLYENVLSKMDSVEMLLFEIMNRFNEIENIENDTNTIGDVFDLINKEAFNGTLPEISIYNKPLQGEGAVGLYTRVDDDRWIVLDLSLLYNYNDLKNVLAHEMIHYYIDYNDIEDNDDHGYYFKYEMERINGLGLGYDIDLVYNLLYFNHAS